MINKKYNLNNFMMSRHVTSRHVTSRHVFYFKLFQRLCLYNNYKSYYIYSEFLSDKIVYIFEFFIHFSKIHYEKSNFLVFLIHEYHCMILVVCYNINKKLKNAIDKAKE